MILGIDVGSTYLKSSILDIDEKKVMESGQTKTPAFVPLAPDRKEIPAQELTNAVKELIDRAAAEHHIDGVVFSVQMHGFLLFEKDGTPLTNYISWQDTRAVTKDENGDSILERFKREMPKDLARENGINLRPNHSLLPLTHYLGEHPELRDKEFAMIGDAITRMLTGTRVSMHPSQAASSGMYSLVRKDWNRDLIRWLGFDDIDFPKVEESREPLAFYHGAYDIPIYTAIGDHQASVFGAMVEDGDMVINIGTGGQMAYIDNGVKFGDYETRPFFAGRTTRAGTQLPSGRQLNTLIEFITDIGNEIFGAETDKETAWNYVDGLNDRPGDTEGLKLDFGFFDSDGGSISGISGSNLTVRKFFHAVYDSMSEAYYQKSRVLTDAGDKVSGKIICTGGVVRKNRVLLDFFADKFGMNCAMAPYVEDSMMGLLRFMRWCVYDEKLM